MTDQCSCSLYIQHVYILPHVLGLIWQANQRARAVPCSSCLLIQVFPLSFPIKTDRIRPILITKCFNHMGVLPRESASMLISYVLSSFHLYLNQRPLVATSTQVSSNGQCDPSRYHMCHRVSSFLI